MDVYGTVGYARNSVGIKRNVVTEVARTPMRRGKGGKGGFDESMEPSLTPMEGSRETEFPTTIYKRAEVKIARRIPGEKSWLGEFDYRKYNETAFGGLENGISNDYVNSWIQILYFIPSIREGCLAHSCDLEHCLACELNFLFRMLDDSHGLNCQVRLTPL